MSAITVDLILFAIGFFVLIRGAQILVHGAVTIANIFKVSTWFIGAVIVSIGTSIPELSINIAAAVSGSDVGIATILGSNMFNILFVLGFLAVFSPIVMHKQWVFRDLPMFIGITILTGIFILLPAFGDPSVAGITRAEAGVLVFVFLAWLIQMFRRWNADDEQLDFEVVTTAVAIAMIVGGVLGVFVGGQWVVDGAITIAELFGVSPAVIGFTVVALGTSLPEFVVSLVALSKGTLGIAVGNIVGSSIFNLLGVLSVTALIQPIITEEPLLFDVLFLIGISVLWFGLMLVGKRYTLSRPEGLLFLILYGYFVTQLFIT